MSLFTFRPYDPPVAKSKDDGKSRDDKIAKAYADWQSAEGKYGEALARFTKDGQPESVSKASALALAELRGAADAKMSTYFKRAVKAS